MVERHRRRTTNTEVMFRASNDNGATFSDKKNLSNTTNADSIDAELTADGTDVVVTWWEHNQTDNVPIAKISNDGGGTFNDLIRLSANGIITQEGER
jgi:hypothetical protein